MQPLISVIVPIYNVEKYLPMCIESIQKQTYQNLEILLIDDGAKDSSGAICDRYAKNDSRITVYHNENAGLSATRNFGIAHVNGEFFCIVDGDDSVRSDYIEVMYRLIENEPDADFSICSYVYTWSDGRQKRTRNADYPDNFVFKDTGMDALKKMLYGKIYPPSTWGKLYRTARFTEKFVPHYSNGEDVLAAVNYFQKTKLVIMENQPCYLYLQNDNSLTHAFHAKRFFDNVLTAEEIYRKCENLSPAIKKAAAYYLVEKNLIVLMKLYGHDECKDKLSIIGKNIKQHRVTVLFDKNAEMRTRAACMLSYLGINTLCKIRNKISK